MKKYLIPLLLCLVLALPVALWGDAAQVGEIGSGAAGGATCTDDFSTCASGSLEDHADWGEQRTDDAFTCDGSEISHDGTGAPDVIHLTSCIPTDPDYTVSVKMKFATDTAANEYAGPVIRGSVVADAFDGYSIMLEQGGGGGDYITIRRYIANNGSSVAAATAIGTYTWTTYHTVALKAVTNGAQVDITVYVDDVEKFTVNDTDAARILTAGKGGLLGHSSQAVDFDDFTLEN